LGFLRAISGALSVGREIGDRIRVATGWLHFRYALWRGHSYVKRQTGDQTGSTQRIGGGAGVAASRRRITVQNLIDISETMPPDWRDKRDRRSLWLAMSIIKFYLGLKWVERHLDPEAKNPFLRVGTPSGRVTELQAYAVVELGELLFNLQEVHGFENFIKEMRPETPEPRLAELRVARMLYVNNAAFRFVERAGKRGRDYDLEILMPFGATVCADTKCKLRTAKLNGNTIRNTLKKHLDQLPADMPGMYFVSFPQTWLENPDYHRVTTVAATDFFKTTKRVVSVIFHCEAVRYINGWLGHGQHYTEVMNPNHRFDRSANWRLLEGYGITRGEIRQWVRFRDISPEGYREGYGETLEN
jgi:hypothetical protein